MEAIIRPLLERLQVKLDATDEAILGGVASWDIYQQLLGVRRTILGAKEEVSIVARQLEMEGIDD